MVPFKIVSRKTKMRYPYNHIKYCSFSFHPDCIHPIVLDFPGFPCFPLLQDTAKNISGSFPEEGSNKYLLCLLPKKRGKIEIARDAPQGFFRAPAEHSKQCQSKRKTAPMPNSSAISWQIFCSILWAITYCKIDLVINPVEGRTAWRD